MNNKAIWFILFFMVGLLANTMTATAEGEDLLKRSNGYSAQGDVLIPYDIVFRCNLGTSGTLELDADCVHALACDKRQVLQEMIKNKKSEGKTLNIDEKEFNGDHEVNCMMGAYTKAGLDYIIPRLILGGNHENMTAEQSGKETAPTLGIDGVEISACSSLKKQCDEEQEKQQKKQKKKQKKQSDNEQTGDEQSDNGSGNWEPTSCTLYQRCEEMLQQAQTVKDCKDEQSSTRCVIQANNTLSANGTQVLVDILRSRAMLLRTELSKNIINHVLPNKPVDKSKCLSDIKEMANAGRGSKADE